MSLWAVVVVQLVERLLPTPEVHGSNPVIGKFLYWTFNCLPTVICVEKTKIKKKRPEWPKNAGPGWSRSLPYHLCGHLCTKSSSIRVGHKALKMFQYSNWGSIVF